MYVCVCSIFASIVCLFVTGSVSAVRLPVPVHLWCLPLTLSNNLTTTFLHNNNNNTEQDVHPDVVRQLRDSLFAVVHHTQHTSAGVCVSAHSYCLFVCFVCLFVCFFICLLFLCCFFAVVLLCLYFLHCLIHYVACVTSLTFCSCQQLCDHLRFVLSHHISSPCTNCCLSAYRPVRHSYQPIDTLRWRRVRGPRSGGGGVVNKGCCH